MVQKRLRIWFFQITTLLHCFNLGVWSLLKGLKVVLNVKRIIVFISGGVQCECKAYVMVRFLIFEENGYRAELIKEIIEESRNISQCHQQQLFLELL